jgi:redox-sensitive bicupin YhaK (pirin superfamily)
MSWLPGAKAEEDACEDQPFLDMIIIPRTNDIGGFEVHRALPFRNKRMVGPFIFWDQMGPGEFLTGQGIDVRPHPHIGLSTVTYLFDGTLDHKDSLGTAMRIEPGDVNVMTAGSGIVHSERTGQDIRQHDSSLYGIQSWIAQPKSQELGDCFFHHTGKSDLPVFEDKGVKGRVILGEYQGVQSPVPLQWDTLYVDMGMEAGAQCLIPARAEERALYVVEGDIEIHSIAYPHGQMLVLHPGEALTVRAKSPVRLMLLGGATMDGPRHIWWNFVASDKQRLQQAKKDWKEGRFATIPGDNKDFIPLPDHL